MHDTVRPERLAWMRALLLLVLVLTACTTERNVATSPTPTPTASVTATPTRTPTSSPTASPSPITLPSIAQLSAPSGTVVWALVGGQRLFRSSDRGDTWVERSLAAPLANLEMSFSDETNGLVMTAASVATGCESLIVSIWRTTDAATSWQKLTVSGVSDSFCKRGLASADATHAFLAATKADSASVVYRTADGGASWRASAPLPTPPNIASQGATFITITGRPRAFGSLVLVDGGGGQQTKDVFRSTDGGATFAYASTVPTFEGSVAYVTATRWLQIATPNSSEETTDGGVSWHAYTTDYSQAAPVAPDIVFGDASVGYATVRGAIQRTTDGGAHWTAIKTPGT
jgi:photosystem II stability/assembly factor-like uncharacterized protein